MIFIMCMQNLYKFGGNMYNKSYLRLLIGQSTSNLGDSLNILVLTIFVYQITNSTFIASIVVFLQFFGQSVGAMLAPLVIDKYSSKALIIKLQIYRLILFTLVIYIMFQSVTMLTIPVLGIVIALISLLDGGIIPVRNSMIPRLVDNRNLAKANSYITTSDQSMLLLGWLLGGLLFSTLGTYLLVITIGLYIFSLFAMLLIKNVDSYWEKQLSIKQRFTSGWRLIINRSDMKVITILETISFCGRSIWTSSIILVYVKEVLNKQESWLGFINSGYFIGSIIGGGVIICFSKILQQNMLKNIIYSSIVVAFINFILGVNEEAWISLFLVLILGIAFQIRSISVRTYTQKMSDDYELPRILSLNHSISMLFYGGSILLMSVITDEFSVVTVFYINSMIFIISTVLTFYLSRKSYF